jgi:hypothetical protein
MNVVQSGLLIFGVVDVQVAVRMVCFESQKVVKLRNPVVGFASDLTSWIRSTMGKVGIKSFNKGRRGLIVMKDIGTFAYKSLPCINMV